MFNFKSTKEVTIRQLSSKLLAKSQCLKNNHKVSFYNIASEASYICFQIRNLPNTKKNLNIQIFL